MKKIITIFTLALACFASASFINGDQITSCYRDKDLDSRTGAGNPIVGFLCENLVITSSGDSSIVRTIYKFDATQPFDNCWMNAMPNDDLFVYRKWRNTNVDVEVYDEFGIVIRRTTMSPSSFMCNEAYSNVRHNLQSNE